MATEIEPSMPMAEMTDDMQMVTTWGVLRGYRDELAALKAENERLRERLCVLSPDQYARVMAILGNPPPPSEKLRALMLRAAESEGNHRAALKQD